MPHRSSDSFMNDSPIKFLSIGKQTLQTSKISKPLSKNMAPATDSKISPRGLGASIHSRSFETV